MRKCNFSSPIVTSQDINAKIRQVASSLHTIHFYFHSKSHRRRRTKQSVSSFPIYALISNPFSFKDFKDGSGGTLATHGLAMRPATMIWQVAQSPFLQEYLGLTPNCFTAFFKGDPALKFFFFPRKVNTVICKEEEEDIGVDKAFVEVVKASAERQATIASRMVKMVFMVKG